MKSLGKGDGSMAGKEKTGPPVFPQLRTKWGEKSSKIKGKSIAILQRTYRAQNPSLRREYFSRGHFFLHL